MKAKWNGKIIADSDETIVIEGNHYFPESKIYKEYFKPSEFHTTCHWKGQASYFDIVVNGNTNRNAAWYYPYPVESSIETVGEDFSNYVAFWNGVQIIE